MHCVRNQIGFGVAVLALGLLAQAEGVHAQVKEDLGFSTPSSVVQGSGARALGMGGAFLARPDDATAVSWNPAGLSYLARPEMSVVGAFRKFDRITATPAGTILSTEEFRGTNPDFLSGAWPVRIGSVSGSVQLAYQRVLGFGGTREWAKVPSDFQPGSTVETIDFEGDSSGGFDTLSVGVGFRVARPLRVGLVINRWVDGFEDRRERLNPARRSVQEVTFDLSGWNINFGAIVHPVESLNVGFVYKGPFKADVDLSRRRSDNDGVVSASGAATLDFPGAVGLGLSWRVTSPFTVSADFTRSYWSDGRIQNFILWGRTPETKPELYYPTLAEAPAPAQVDSDQWRVGGEYVIVGSKVSVPLRAGYYIDRQYFVDAWGKAPRYDGVTAGVGIVLRGLLVDIAYVRQQGSYWDPESPAPALGVGRARVTTHQVFGSLIYRFGRN